MSGEAMVLDGKRVARDIKAALARRVEAEFATRARPHLAVVLLSADAASHRYAQAKAKACQELGLECDLHDLSAQVGAPDGPYACIRDLAADERVHGVFVEQPLPPSVDPLVLEACIPPEKDVEGTTGPSLGRLLQGRPGLVPATPAAVMAILDAYGIPLEGKRAVIVGRSTIVGKPLWALLLARHATVTVCHSRTGDLAGETCAADVLVASMGRARFIGSQHVREGAVVVDVGINFEDGRMVGDVDFEAVRAKAGAITPVPGGVGPVTTAMLMSNLVEAAARQRR